MQDSISYMEARSPANGAKLVARAWVNPSFKAFYSPMVRPQLRTEHGPRAPRRVHRRREYARAAQPIVCTLCSCYPRAILGRPPDWYKSFAYRSRAVREPRAVMREFGFEPRMESRSLSTSTADVRYMVLPMRPTDTEDLSEEELAELVTRDSLVGVNVPRAPSRTGLADGLTRRRGRRAD